MIFVVDTHALVWYLEDSPKLGQAARGHFDDRSARLTVPTIVLAEARFMEESGRTRVSWDEIVQALDADPRFEVYPLTLDVLRRMPRTRAIEMHDAIVCATAGLVAESALEDVQVITKDRTIVGSGLVETVW